MTNKLIGAAIAAAAIVAPAVALAQTGPSVIVVDIDRVGAECNACKVASSQFNGMVQQAQARAQTLRTQLQTAGAPLQASINALNGKPADAALQARVTAFQQQEASANTELTNSQQRLQSIQQNINRQILEKLGPITDAILKQRGALIAMARNSTLANADSVDVTTDVLAQVNAQLPSISVTPLPQPAGATAPAATPTAPVPTAPRRGR